MRRLVKFLKTTSENSRFRGSATKPLRGDNGQVLHSAVRWLQSKFANMRDPFLVWLRAKDNDAAPSLEQAVRGVIRAMPTISLIMAVAVIGTLVWLKLFGVVTYSAQMTVIPFIERNPAPSGALNGLASLVGISNTQSPNFNLYLETRTSVALAERLIKIPRIRDQVFKGQWDEQSGAWKEPEASWFSIHSAIRWILGLPGLSPPRPIDLADFLKSAIKDEDIHGIRHVLTYNNPDPEFAVYLLNIVHSETEALLRDKAKEQTLIKIDHLMQQITTTTVAENREALVNLLAEQQRQLMLINPALPYAAIIVDPATASHYPVAPRPILDIFLAAAVVGILGSAFAAWRAIGFRLPRRRFEADGDKAYTRGELEIRERQSSNHSL